MHNAHGCEWREAQAPDLASGDANKTTGRLRGCGYCGSMHPSDLAAAIRAGATLSWADRKYGWPHKVYAERVPNPHAGMMESRMGCSHATPTCPKTGAPCAGGDQSFQFPQCECLSKAPETVKEGMRNGVAMRVVQQGFRRDNGKPEFTWRDVGEPAAATTWGKFYSEHLKDATPEERVVIERAMGLSFTFEGTRVEWRVFVEPAAPAAG